MIKTKDEFMNSMGHFTWMWGQDFFIEINETNQNFIWKDPSYDGDGSVIETELTYDEFCKKSNIDFGRDKGFNLIANKIGTVSSIKFI